MPFTVSEFRDLLRILEEHPEWRAEMRRVLLGDELLQLPTLVQRIVDTQAHTDELVQMLVQQMGILTQRVDQLTELVRELTVQFKELREWRQGEAGLREGERYERYFIKRALLFFRGGRGGATDSPHVQEQLSAWLRPLFERDEDIDADSDPTLADLIWWKNGKVLVVEISLKVARHDVNRSYRRAQTLRSVGVDATPVVVGRQWANNKVRELARAQGVEWVIENAPSVGIIQFRRLLT